MDHGLTPQDAHNILTLLNRVQLTGVTEAKLVAVLAHKLEQIKKPTEAPNVEDAAASD